jgi:hypothetical protein
MAAQREATQQPAGTMRQHKGGTVRGGQEDKMAVQQGAKQQPAGTMRGQEGGVMRG